VLDGGVGGAGWNSWDEERYGVPRIANINKLDIPAASVKKTLASIEMRLTVQRHSDCVGWGG